MTRGHWAQQGATPLCVAAGWGYLAVTVLLLEAGANMEAKTMVSERRGGGGRWFGGSVSWVHRRSRILLPGGLEIGRDHRGARADAGVGAPQYGTTPLSIAAQGGCSAVAQVLLQARANKEAKDPVREIRVALVEVGLTNGGSSVFGGEAC